MATEASEAIATMILERQRSRVGEWERRQAAKRAEREQKRRRRDAGLMARHAAKLAGLGERTS